ncbi:MAG: hypothetical protein Q9167_000527 [Letrouitia subvulpina]
MADSDYYSHSESNGNPTLLDDGRFLDFGVSLAQAHKTGLGSSAALVTAFTAAVLAYYKDDGHISLSSEYERACLHNLAQAAHCAAQGKVGSGFDVAAAVYGSCVYRRFSPSILQGLGEIGSKSFSSRLQAVVEDTNSLQKWDTQIDKSLSVIPKGLRLFMCDVDCGSETVGLVKQVLSWKKEDPDEATRIWTTLQKENEVLAQELRRLSRNYGEGAGDYTNLGDIVLKIRSLIREMSSKAGVPIEPEVQTRLIDACRQLPGVVAGLVPGAGGFDAVALLVRDDEVVFSSLKEFLGSYRSPSDVADGGTSVGKVKLLGVKQEMEGLKEEDAKIYAQWIQ